MKGDNPTVFLDAWGEKEDIKVAKFQLAKKQLQSLEYYVLITPPDGESFAVRINELRSTLALIDNAGDTLDLKGR